MATSLWTLATGESLNALKKALGAGADPDEPGPGRETALVKLAGEGSMPGVRLLIDAGADVHAVTARGTALYQAVAGRHLAIVELLLSHGARAVANHPLHKAVQNGDVAIVRALLEAGAPVNKPSRQGYTERDYLKRVTGSAHAAIAALLDAASAAKGSAKAKAKAPVAAKKAKAKVSPSKAKPSAKGAPKRNAKKLAKRKRAT